MKNIRIITSAYIRSFFKTKASLMQTLIITIVFSAAGIFFVCYLAIIPALKAGTPDKLYIEFFLALITYCVFMFGVGIYADIYTISLLRDKAGEMESLLSAPVRLREIWISRSIAMFLPGCITGGVLALATLLFINMLFIVPRIGFLISPWATVNGFLAVPLLYLGFSLLAPLVMMKSNPIIGVIVAYMPASAILPLVINIVLRFYNVIGIISGNFMLLHLGIALFLCLIVLLLNINMSNEKAILNLKR